MPSFEMGEWGDGPSVMADTVKIHSSGNRSDSCTHRAGPGAVQVQEQHHGAAVERASAMPMQGRARLEGVPGTEAPASGSGVLQAGKHPRFCPAYRQHSVRSLTAARPSSQARSEQAHTRDGRELLVLQAQGRLRPGVGGARVLASGPRACARERPPCTLPHRCARVQADDDSKLLNGRIARSPNVASLAALCREHGEDLNYIHLSLAMHTLASLCAP